MLHAVKAGPKGEASEPAGRRADPVQAAVDAY